MTEQEKKRNRRSDWFGSGPFNWFNETLAAIFPLIIIIVTAILAAILFPLFAKAREGHRHKSVQSELKAVAASITEYERRHGRFPEEKDWFKAVNIGGRRFSCAPLDFWETPVIYKIMDNGRSAVIISAGRDRKFGSDNDITVRIVPD